MIKLIEEVIKSGGGCTINEYKEMVIRLSRIKDLRLLVFSCGHDSLLWKEVAGKTLFIEDIPSWAEMARKKFGVDIIEVKYPTHNKNMNAHLSIKDNLDTSCLNVARKFKANAIFVDGPRGYGDGAGRMIPLKWSGTEDVELIFVHDYNRVTERAYALTHLTNKYELVSHIEKLAVFKRKIT